MNPRVMSEVARSLDAQPEMVPYLAELLADVDELGGSADQIAEVVGDLGLARELRAADLACGKGVVAVRLAKELGFRVVGVDAFEPFVERARERAAEHGVTDRCAFRCADLREVITSGDLFDVVLMIALGPVLGDMAVTVGELRKCVRPGGYMVIDDAYLAAGAGLIARYEGYSGHEEMLGRLTVYGDELVREVIPSPEEIRRGEAEITAAIRRRAEGLAREHPVAAEMASRYVATQERESRLLGDGVMYALWVLRRRG